MIYVIKRSGERVVLDITKIEAAIIKAFNATYYKNYASQHQEHINKVYKEVSNFILHTKTEKSFTVEEIQTLIETSLMVHGFYKVAKNFILYREKHKENREVINKLNFLINYCKADNAANGSKFDANANVENKNIATLMGELPKSNFIQLNRKLLADAITTRYNKDLSEKYLELLNSHILYKNDETSLANYCASITMYPWLLEGTKSIGGNSIAPTNLKSFCGGFINMVFMVAGMLSGAVATPEFLMYMDYFIRLEYGEDYINKLDTIVELSNKQRTLKKVLSDYFEQIVYSLNQPTGARNYQAVFWNISYYDRYYFNSLFENFVFPDNSKPNWETTSVLQKLFMKWFNAERLKIPITFPVESMALLTDGEQPKDKEYGNFTAEMYAEGHSFFTYISDSADSLSSCCFNKDTKVLWKSSIKGVNITTLKELHDLNWETDKNNLRIFHNGSWVSGKTIKLPNRSLLKVTTKNNKEYFMTDNHINVTYDGEKQTSELTTEDYLMFNTKELQGVPEKDEKLTYEEGFLVGAFLGDGSFGAKIKGCIYETIFSFNEFKCSKCVSILNKGISNRGLKNTLKIGKEHNNTYSCRVSSKELVNFIKICTNWKEGTKAHDKELNLSCLLQSVDFRKGILDGWFYTDGGNSNRCYTTSEKLKDSMEALITSLGLNSIITYSDRTNEKVIIRGEEFNRNHPLWCVRWYTTCNRRKNKDIYKWKNNSQYFKIKSIEKVNYEGDVYCIERSDSDEPYFTLPSGLITHNCRLRNEIQDNEFSYTLGAGGVSTGSKSVLTINLNRCIQAYYKDNLNSSISNNGAKKDLINLVFEGVEDVVDIMHKVQIAYNDNLIKLKKDGLLPLFDAGYINIKRQYLTIGVNGLVEAAEFLGIEISDNEEYVQFVQTILGIIEKKNKEYRTKDLMFNCEMIPR